MNIPSSLNIVGREYDVIKVEECDDQVGGVNFETCTIVVKDGQQRLLEADTLLHESLHIIDEIFQLELTERQVYCITSGLIALLRDNAALMPYINDALLSPRKVV
jgi:hypothetical protein